MLKGNGYERERGLDALAHVASVRRKIEAGIYPTEEVPCVCGAAKDEPLISVDRYGLPYAAVVCLNCALIRATPRMTGEAYRRFYNEHYRRVNYPHYNMTGPKCRADDDRFVFEQQVRKGERLKEALDRRRLPRPKVVVDFGCSWGGSLAPFMDESEVYGVEIDESALALLKEAQIPTARSIEELAARGVKADLVIMQDVIEHLTDLGEVAKISAILSESGLLYVWTPGFFRSDEVGRWQIAHIYQFCARTLEYVMGLFGFTAMYVDEEIFSLWSHTGEKTEKVAPPAEWAEYILDDVKGKKVRKLPPFSPTLKFTVHELFENATRNAARAIPDLRELVGKYSGPLIILSAGPSVDQEIETIRELAKKGVPLMAISRMYPYAIERLGIVPDFVVSMDCSEEQEKGFINPQEKTVHLLASVTRPSIVDRLEGYKRYLWDSRNDVEFLELRRKNGYRSATIINTGSSVSVACFSLATLLGFRDLHVFGFDCMVSREKQYAEGIAGESLGAIYYECEIEGEKFQSNNGLLTYARQMLDLAAAAQEDGILDSIKFYGESAVNKLWDGNFEEAR